eukprot:gnl/TRDRNA2_/TRDRNA2_183644_c0_seq1.p1 gnl/TRDRNA2_/TRDRNA2_183644_c0~~gnl/TRDRNA2_/TRDRNA2_183644_c0_seq1.p1  ORF type:complete len:278 (+),score=35.59 gnl/TRDRNA2_/TRDRNA2_183644_c0_seq1:119-952(+)
MPPVTVASSPSVSWRARQILLTPSLSPSRCSQTEEDDRDDTEPIEYAMLDYMDRIPRPLAEHLVREREAQQRQVCRLLEANRQLRKQVVAAEAEAQAAQRRATSTGCSAPICTVAGPDAAAGCEVPPAHIMLAPTPARAAQSRRAAGTRSRSPGFADEAFFAEPKTPWCASPRRVALFDDESQRGARASSMPTMLASGSETSSPLLRRKRISAGAVPYRHAAAPRLSCSAFSEGFGMFTACWGSRGKTRPRSLDKHTTEPLIIGGHSPLPVDDVTCS